MLWRPRGVADVQFYSFFNFGCDGWGVVSDTSWSLYCRERDPVPRNRKLGGPQGRCVRARKIPLYRIGANIVRKYVLCFIDLRACVRVRVCVSEVWGVFYAVILLTQNNLAPSFLREADNLSAGQENLFLLRDWRLLTCIQEFATEVLRKSNQMLEVKVGHLFVLVSYWVRLKNKIDWDSVVSS
jgi:hypothetical protein